MRVHTLILGVLLAGCGDSRPGPQGDPGTLVTNALVNGGFEIWQRGSSDAPDMWGATDAGCSFAQETVEKRIT